MEFRRRVFSSTIPLLLLLVAIEAGLAAVAADGYGKPAPAPAACKEAIPGMACENTACDTSCRDVYHFPQGGECRQVGSRTGKPFCQCRDGSPYQAGGTRWHSRLIVPASCVDATCSMYCKQNGYPLGGSCEMVSDNAPLCMCEKKC
ncbi:hypothetical protein ACP4OV_003131 [Aristida adscensionis]